MIDNFDKNIITFIDDKKPPLSPYEIVFEDIEDHNGVYFYGDRIIPIEVMYKFIQLKLSEVKKDKQTIENLKEYNSKLYNHVEKLRADALNNTMVRSFK